MRYAIITLLALFGCGPRTHEGAQDWLVVYRYEAGTDCWVLERQPSPCQGDSEHECLAVLDGDFELAAEEMGVRLDSCWRVGCWQVGP